MRPGRPHGLAGTSNRLAQLVARGEDIGNLDAPGTIIAQPELLFDQAETLRLAGYVHYSRGRIEEAFVLLMRFCRLYDVIVAQTSVNPLQYVDVLDTIRDNYGVVAGTIDEIDAQLRSEFAAAAESPPSFLWSSSREDDVETDQTMSEANAGDVVCARLPSEASGLPMGPMNKGDLLLARLRAALADESLSRRTPSVASRDGSARKTSVSMGHVRKASAARVSRSRVLPAAVASVVPDKGASVSMARGLRSSLRRRLEQGTRRMGSRLRRIGM